MESFIVVVVLAKAMVEVRVSVISKRLLVRFCAGVLLLMHWSLKERRQAALYLDLTAHLLPTSLPQLPCQQLYLPSA